MTVIGFVNESRSEEKTGNDGKSYEERIVNVEGMRCRVAGKGALPLVGDKIEASVTATYVPPKEGEQWGRTVYKIVGLHVVAQ